MERWIAFIRLLLCAYSTCDFLISHLIQQEDHLPIGSYTYKTSVQPSCLGYRLQKVLDNNKTCPLLYEFLG